VCQEGRAIVLIAILRIAEVTSTLELDRHPQHVHLRFKGLKVLSADRLASGALGLDERIRLL
jgi:hypothetical protein